jgi:flavin-dependent dehydrogenase
MHNLCPVAIIGAGPYGLSIAAHLRARGARPAHVCLANMDGTPRLPRRYDAYWRLYDPLPALFHASFILFPTVNGSIRYLRRAWKWANSHLSLKL